MIRKNMHKKYAKNNNKIIKIVFTLVVYRHRHDAGGGER